MQYCVNVSSVCAITTLIFQCKKKNLNKNLIAFSEWGINSANSGEYLKKINNIFIIEVISCANQHQNTTISSIYLSLWVNGRVNQAADGSVGVSGLLWVIFLSLLSSIVFFNKRILFCLFATGLIWHYARCWWWRRVWEADTPSCCQTHTNCELFSGGGW